jgi:hypothetical protein
MTTDITIEIRGLAYLYQRPRRQQLALLPQAEGAFKPAANDPSGATSEPAPETRADPNAPPGRDAPAPEQDAAADVARKTADQPVEAAPGATP